MEGPIGKKTSIFDYDSYREFLKDTYERLKATNPKFSFRYFSRMAGFKSSAVLKLAMEGKRNIAAHSIDKFAKALKLSKDEAFFFHHLVMLNQAESLDDKRYHAEQMVSCKKLKELRPLAEAQFKYYRHWYYVPVRELVGLAGFQEDPEWVAGKISPKITTVEAAEALDALLQLGLIQRDEAGKLKQTDLNVSTGDEVQSTAVHLWHLEMLKKGGESIDRHAWDTRDISAATIGVSADTVSKLKDMIVAFRNAIIDETSKAPAPDRVYQLGIQFFPLSDPTIKK